MRRTFTTEDIKAATAARAKYKGTVKAKNASRAALAVRWPKRTTEERFWSHVTQSGQCWEWTGSRPHGKYGRFRVGDKFKAAHRYSWELAKGAIPDGYLVCHRCDNMKCVRPDHMFLGTQVENMQDAKRKGRAYQPGQHATQGPDGRWQKKQQRSIEPASVAGMQLPHDGVRDAENI